MRLKGDIWIMMGSKERAFAPLVNVSLEQLVPADHFYRNLHKSLNLSFVRDLVAPFYAAGGRPSVDPVVFFKLQLVMFFEGVRSERQLVSTAADRLSLRWYLGYDLHEELPDHSSLTRIRDRYGVDTFRRFFECIVEQCQEAGLVWGKELYFDGTQVEANADDDTMLPRFYVESTQAMRAMRADLTVLFPNDPHAAGSLSGGMARKHTTSVSASAVSARQLLVGPEPTCVPGGANSMRAGKAYLGLGFRSCGQLRPVAASDGDLPASLMPWLLSALSVFS